MASSKRHPVATTLPKKRGQPARIELNVLKLDADGNSIYDDYDPSVCHCFPNTSSLHIPSMLYDHINCPHHTRKNIQPAQDQVFAYPWTANSDDRMRRPRLRKSPDHAEVDSLASEKISIVDEQRDTPTVIRTAPPFATGNPSKMSVYPPFSAPADSKWGSHKAPGDIPRAGSVPSLTGFHQPRTPKGHGNPQVSTPYVSRLSKTPAAIRDRHFDGRYIDPKDGQVYKFKVKYGKNDIEAARSPDSVILEKPEEYT